MGEKTPQTLGESAGRWTWATFGIGASVLTADQITKWLVAAKLGPDEISHRRQVVGDVVAIHYVENSGVAFGLLQGQTILVTVMAILVVILLVRMYRRVSEVSWTMASGCGLIIGGAIGNLVDRARLGYVVDFVEISAWPKFNLADSAITVGALLLAWRFLREDGREMTGERGSPDVPGNLVLLKHDGDR
ncbi:MAG: signal peptidase [Thermomicrobiales bacterium]|nr:signal peptidase [Thermomicrobiales bacterium]